MPPRQVKLGPGVRLVYTRRAQSLLLEGPPMTLVDTGAPGSLARIVRAVRKTGSRLEDLEQIVLTHAHAGHAGVAAELRRLTGARVLVHPADADVATGRKPPYALAPRGLVGATLAPVLPVLERRAAFPPVEVDGLLQDGQELDPGIVIVHTPGHTPGHVSVLVPESRLLHVADAAVNLAGLWPPPALGNQEEMAVYLSIRRISDLPLRRVSFGHGPPIFREAPRRMARLARRYRVG